MARPMIPRFEPEVIAAAVRKFGDDAKAATTSLKRLIPGVRLVSQKDRVGECERMAALGALPSAWRCAIVSVGWGDTECCIELRPCNPEAAAGIAQTLEPRDVVVNGVSLCEIDFSDPVCAIGMPLGSRKPVGAR